MTKVSIEVRYEGESVVITGSPHLAFIYAELLSRETFVKELKPRELFALADLLTIFVFKNDCDIDMNALIDSVEFKNKKNLTLERIQEYYEKEY